MKSLIISHLLLVFFLTTGFISAQEQLDTIVLSSGLKITGTTERVNHANIFLRQLKHDKTVRISLKDVDYVIRRSQIIDSLIYAKYGGYRSSIKYHPDLYENYSNGKKIQIVGGTIMGLGATISLIAYLSGLKDNSYFSPAISIETKSKKTGNLVLSVSCIAGASLLVSGTIARKKAVSEYNNRILFPEKLERASRGFSLEFTGTGLTYTF